MITLKQQTVSGIKTKCPICSNDVETEFSGNSWKIDESGRSFEYVSCKQCELTFSNPTPTSEELSLFYSTKYDYNWFTKRRLLKRIQGYHRWSRIKNKLKRTIGGKGSLLDIGCGPGWFIEAAKKDGWDVTGVDLGLTVMQSAKEKLNMIEGSIEEVALPVGNFDVVTMWHSLEHTINPAKVLEKIKTLLKPGGVLLIAVPNFNCLGQKRKGIKWVWLQPPFVHIWHFSKKSMKEYFKKTGLEIIHIETRDTWDASYLYDGILNPKLDGKYCYSVACIVASIFKRLKLGDYYRVMDKTHFVLSEVSRILVYMTTFILAPLVLNSRKQNGSELLVLAKILKNNIIYQ